MAGLAWLLCGAACGDATPVSELGSGGASTGVTSSAASGAGKALPCGAKTCENVCCLVSHDGGGIFCAGSPNGCPATAAIKTECAGAADCGAGQVCCGAAKDRFFTACRAYCADGEEQFCEAQAECTAGTCSDVAWNGPTGYRACR